ncbi:hypothetical protein [Natrinema sp. DC36]|uniref:hypothetical protein n=1 Tax=Natrinema sp. DC36 TaxID=2878680 RepID=UPI001CF06F4D|nr:hypothetical protein [Natrinema sp. DC36]
MTDTQTVDDTLFEVVTKRTEPTPDGVTNAEGNIWTSQTRLKQEASKGNVPCSRDEIGDAVERLIDAGRLVSWHGLLAPVTDEHLTAIIENEQRSGFTRKILISKVNKIRGGM